MVDLLCRMVRVHSYFLQELNIVCCKIYCMHLEVTWKYMCNSVNMKFEAALEITTKDTKV